MSSNLPATLGIVAILMASPAWANEDSASSGKSAEGPSLTLPTDHFAKMPIDAFMLFPTHGGIPHQIPAEAWKLETLTRAGDNLTPQTAPWGQNPMETAMKKEDTTVGGPGDDIDFDALNREGISRLPLAAPGANITEMFSVEIARQHLLSLFPNRSSEAEPPK